MNPLGDDDRIGQSEDEEGDGKFRRMHGVVSCASRIVALSRGRAALAMDVRRAACGNLHVLLS
jgi:hypothetical protein